MGLLDDQTQQEYYDGIDHGNYQFTSLDNIINQFMTIYVGEDKIIPNTKRVDVAFHAQRALAELSFDTLKSVKAQEFIVPATLQMPLPQDYVNYTKISWVDSSGIKHLMYPTSKTSNPSSHKSFDSSSVAYQNSDGDFKLKAVGTFTINTDTVVLDGDYDNIVTGMSVKVPNGISSIITNISTTSGITTVTMANDWTKATANREIEFIIGGELISKTNKTARITGSYSAGENIITASSTTDAAKVEVGMHVISQDVYTAKVVDVQGDKITVDNNFPLLGSAVEINFISYDHESEAWKSYKSTTPSENNNDDYEDDTYWPMDGERYGLDPQHAQANGSFYIDQKLGKIHFSSNISGKTVILDYISDSLGTDNEMQVHKFAEEAIYKWISYGVVSGRSNIPEYVVQRLKKERFAETRKAKLRLSNIKLEEITQILRGKSKQIKH